MRTTSILTSFIAVSLACGALASEIEVITGDHIPAL